jgi:hypothetical protein
MKDKEFPMIVLAEAKILEDGFACIFLAALVINIHLAPRGSVYSSLINLQKGAILTLKLEIKREQNCMKPTNLATLQTIMGSSQWWSS